MNFNLGQAMHYNFDSVQDWIDTGMPVNSYVLGDCMEGMAAMPDGFANLAIVDPPYGLNIAKEKPRVSGRWNYIPKKWDSVKPEQNYFDELKHISKNQIIWGGNYFILPPCRGFIIWDKMQPVDNFADCEFAWSSFNRVAKIFRYSITKLNFQEDRIHPTQKPIALYRWCLKNYAQPNDLIVDTHVGSASSLIACEQMGFSYVGFEKDEDYYRDSVTRMIKARELLKQNDLFAPPKSNGHLAETMKLFEE